MNFRISILLSAVILIMYPVMILGDAYGSYNPNIYNPPAYNPPVYNPPAFDPSTFQIPDLGLFDDRGLTPFKVRTDYDYEFDIEDQEWLKDFDFGIDIEDLKKDSIINLELSLSPFPKCKELCSNTFIEYFRDPEKLDGYFLSDILADDMEACTTGSEGMLLVFIGNLNFVSGDYEAAHYYYRYALSMNSRNIAAILNLAYLERIHQSISDETSLASYNKQIDRVPEEPGAYFGRGRKFLTEYRFIEANDDFVQAIDLNGYSPEYFYMMGIVDSLFGDYDISIDNFNIALEQVNATIGEDEDFVLKYSSENPIDLFDTFAYIDSSFYRSSTSSIIRTGIASTHYETGDYNLALEILTEAHEHAPVNTQINSLIAKLYIYNDDIENAIPFINDALHYYSESSFSDTLDRETIRDVLNIFLASYQETNSLPDPDMLYSDGLDFFDNGSLEEAAIAFSAYLVMEPEDPDALYTLSQTCYDLEWYDCTVKHLQRYLWLSPDAPDNSEVTDLLDDLLYAKE